MTKNIEVTDTDRIPATRHAHWTGTEGKDTQGGDLTLHLRHNHVPQMIEEGEIIIIVRVDVKTVEEATITGKIEGIREDVLVHQMTKAMTEEERDPDLTIREAKKRKRRSHLQPIIIIFRRRDPKILNKAL
jgi:hypothetical protein